MAHTDIGASVPTRNPTLVKGTKQIGLAYSRMDMLLDVDALFIIFTDSVDSLSGGSFRLVELASIRH